MRNDEDWMHWARHLLWKLKSYKSLNHRLAIENSLLLEQNRELKSASSLPSFYHTTSSTSSTTTTTTTSITGLNTLQIPTPHNNDNKNIYHCDTAPDSTIATSTTNNNIMKASNQQQHIWSIPSLPAIDEHMDDQDTSCLLFCHNNDNDNPLTPPTLPLFYNDTDHRFQVPTTTTTTTTSNGDADHHHHAKLLSPSSPLVIRLPSATTTTSKRRRRRPPPPPPPPEITRARRQPRLASYALPSLKKKLRRGDQFACNNNNNKRTRHLVDTTTTSTMKMDQTVADITATTITIPMKKSLVEITTTINPLPPQRRPCRHRHDSYALPSLKEKLRQGDRFAANNNY